MSAPKALFSVFILMGLARADSLKCLSGAGNALEGLMKLQRQHGSQAAGSSHSAVQRGNVRRN